VPRRPEDDRALDWQRLAQPHERTQRRRVQETHLAEVDDQPPWLPVRHFAQALRQDTDRADVDLAPHRDGDDLVIPLLADGQCRGLFHGQLYYIAGEARTATRRCMPPPGLELP
jgi:hypothetical protein